MFWTKLTPENRPMFDTFCNGYYRFVPDDELRTAMYNKKTGQMKARLKSMGIQGSFIPEFKKWIPGRIKTYPAEIFRGYVLLSVHFVLLPGPWGETAFFHEESTVRDHGHRAVGKGVGIEVLRVCVGVFTVKTAHLFLVMAMAPIILPLFLSMGVAISLTPSFSAAGAAGTPARRR